ncbi:MAG: prolipoprotein diacylglyceryl transferase [Sandaracinaceae bacterium]|nr:prolipoprotein diacylglyceryl transferase [Sandaracinaceae bacterium]
MHPVLFEIPMPWGGQPVYSYGVMLGLSLLVAWYTIMWLGEKKETLPAEVMRNAFIVTAISAIVCSRLLYAATNPHEFHSVGDLFNLQGGGLVAYGGFLGGLVGAWAFLYSKKQSLLAWADLVAPTLGTGLGLVRVGCYLYGCDFGQPLDASAPAWLRAWGTFPRWTTGMDGSPAWSRHVEAYGLSPLANYSLPVHPTQLYESVVGFALAAVAFALWRKRAFRGQVILVVAVLYGVWRFLIEYVRDDPERGFFFGFSTSQLISIALVPVCGFLYFELRKRAAAEGPPPAPSAAPDAEPEAPRRSKRKKRKKA